MLKKRLYVISIGVYDLKFFINLQFLNNVTLKYILSFGINCEKG